MHERATYTVAEAAAETARRAAAGRLASMQPGGINISDLCPGGKYGRVKAGDPKPIAYGSPEDLAATVDEDNAERMRGAIDHDAERAYQVDQDRRRQLADRLATMTEDDAARAWRAANTPTLARLEF